jgi:translation initiation factor 1
LKLFAGTQWDLPPTCDQCGKLEDRCECPPAPAQQRPLVPPEKQNLVIRKEKRKKGKVVTLLTGLQVQGPEQLKDFLRQLKNQCGTGGKIDGETIEIQGDQVKKMVSILGAQGYRIRQG